MNDITKFKDIRFTRIIAKKAAIKSKEDHVIYKTKRDGHEVYLFNKASNAPAEIEETIRYSRPVKRRNLLQDNGDEKPKPVKKKAVKKDKPGDS